VDWSNLKALVTVRYVCSLLEKVSHSLEGNVFCYNKQHALGGGSGKGGGSINERGDRAAVNH